MIVKLQWNIHSLNSYSQYELHAGAQTLLMQSYTNTEKNFNSSPTLYNLERATQEIEVRWNVSQHDKHFIVTQDREDRGQKLAKFHVKVWEDELAEPLLNGKTQN